MQSLSKLMLLETQRRISSDCVWTEWFPRLRFSIRSSRSLPDPFSSAWNTFPLCLQTIKRRTNVYFVMEWEMCFYYIIQDHLRSPLAPTCANLFFLSRSRCSFALCQGNRHFMSRPWGIKLIKKMHGRLSSIMNTARTGV